MVFASWVVFVYGVYTIRSDLDISGMPRRSFQKGVCSLVLGFRALI